MLSWGTADCGCSFLPPTLGSMLNEGCVYPQDGRVPWESEGSDTPEQDPPALPPQCLCPLPGWHSCFVKWLKTHCAMKPPIHTSSRVSIYSWDLSWPDDTPWAMRWLLPLQFCFVAFCLGDRFSNAAQTDLQFVVIPLTQLLKHFPDSQGITEVRPSTQLLLILFKVLISFTRKKQFPVSFRLREEGGIWGTASAAFAVGFYLGEGAGKIQEGEAVVSAGLSVAGIQWLLYQLVFCRRTH